MSDSPQFPHGPGRIDLPLPPSEAERPLQGAIELDEAALAASQSCPEPEDGPEVSADLVRRALGGRRLGLLAWGLGGVALLSLLELGAFVWRTLADSWWWGGLWCLALTLLGVGVLRVIVHEFRELVRLKRCQDSQSQAQALQRDNLADGARLFCSRLAAQTRAESSRGYARWLEQCESHHTASEQLQLYGQLVLSEADRRARACVMRWSGEAAVLVAISPLAMVDMLLILWRSVRMIDEVAACYGICLGYWSRIRLLRLIGRHMLYAGAAELITDVGLDWLGAELSARLSARLAQGVGAGLLTVRLGLQTMQLCRPIPFTAEQKPRLGQFRSELLALLTSKLGSVLTRSPTKSHQPSGTQHQPVISTSSHQE